MYHKNKKLEIRNVDVSKQAGGKEGRIYNSPKNTVREATVLVTEKKMRQIFAEKNWE